ncbi:MAG: DUF5320 family protein [Candidatus Electryonea clarkiae]|nr:DUF5320 family protein [Candidatus Electryonea clarkiae]MDP8287640.1 DUF5320 family protein [Candidatus Electryonea clarkiae]
MPGFDRTGPQGGGPLTGGGRGLCGSNRRFVDVRHGVGQGGLPRGGGMGHCWGGGRNRLTDGRWMRNRIIDDKVADRIELEGYAKELEDELQATRKELKDLSESTSKSEPDDA